MPHFVVSAAAVAAILAAALPAAADPRAATACGHAQTAAAATTARKPAWSPPSAAGESDGHDQDIVPVGFGWG